MHLREYYTKRLRGEGMCTAIAFETNDHYFGRNLDLEYSYYESVTVMPRNYPLALRDAKPLKNHFALIGMAYVVDGYPLFYDAINEKGLGMAGLSFPENACYYERREDAENIASFELIPYILGKCENVDEAEKILTEVNVSKEAFSKELPPSPLHWMITDKKRSIVVECTKAGMRIYPNPTGVLTNNPSFPQQLFALNNYMSLSKELPVNSFSPRLSLCAYSRGMGALGLPGDLSSMSRFVRACFVKENTVCGNGETESVSQVFHILGAVEQQRGVVALSSKEGDMYEITVYSSCCNLDKGIYYYKTYDNSQICAVDMHKENLDGQSIISYALQKIPQIKWQNR